MSSVVLPIIFAVLIWWFSTGLVLLLNHLPRTTVRWSRWLSSILAAAALAGIVHSADDTSTAGAYCAFTCALLVWGWHELSFLSGWITGPRTVASPPGLHGWRRFSQAVQAILWHELAIAVAGVAIVVLTWDSPNPVAAWTFLVLWIMRTSAKLNLFFGVRNLSEEFLPPHLVYMASFFRRRAMNLLFPFAMAAAVAVCSAMVVTALAAATPLPGRSVGLLLAGTLLALAIVEHALLVLPFNANALWRWAMRTSPAPAPAPHRDANLLQAR